MAEELPAGGVRVSFDWSAPNAGALQETYMLEVRLAMDSC